MKCVQLVGPAVGQNGPCCFFKSFKFCQPEQLANEILNGKSQGSIKSSRILQIGQFFFVRTSPADDPCIGELELLWHDNQTNQSLASVRLYFLPEQTPDGRKSHHGEHEVLAASEKVSLRLEVLGQWITDQVEWTHGLLAPLVISADSSSDKSSDKVENGHAAYERKGPNGLVNGGSCGQQAETCYKQAALNGVSQTEVGKPDQRIGSNKDEDDTSGLDSASVIVLSYPHYCRYRALMLRLGGRHLEKWVGDSLIEALGGFSVTCKNTRVLFCRETFHHEALFNDLNNCDHLAPSVKNRTKKKRLKNSVPAVVARSQSPGSESNTSEEIKSSPKIISSELPANGDVNNVKKNMSEEEKDFLDKLFKFMQERDTPIHRVPHLGFKQIDLFFFYKYAQRLGGYHKITCNKMWKHVYDEMGGNPGSTSAATCTRRHYERLLLPFENHLNGEDYKTPLPKKHSKKDLDGSNDDLMDDEDDDDNEESLSDAFDAPENPESFVEVKTEPEADDKLKIPKIEELTLGVKEDSVEIVEIKEASPADSVPVKTELLIDAKNETMPELSIDESAGSDEEGNIPLAFLPKVNNLKEARESDLPVTSAPKLESFSSQQGGQLDTEEVEILEAKEAEEQKIAESLASQIVGQKKQRVRDNVFSEKERRWNEIRRKNAMARTWIKKGSKSASTSPLPNHRHFGPSTIPDQPGDCANCNLDPAKLGYPPMPSQNNHHHLPGHFPRYAHHKPSSGRTPSLSPSNLHGASKHANPRHLPPSMTLLESSKPLPIANPSPAGCGYITCGIRNPNCCSPSFAGTNNLPPSSVNKQHSTKVNYLHSQPVPDKNTYRLSPYHHHQQQQQQQPQHAKEQSHSNGRISSRSLSPISNQPRPSVIQHTEKIQSPPPGGSQPLPAHMSSSKSIPSGIQQPHLPPSSRSRSFHPGAVHHGSSKSRYDVASLRTSSASSRSGASHLKAPDIYAKTESLPVTARKEMPSLLPIRALPDSFFQQQPPQQSCKNTGKSLPYPKERAQQINRDTGSYSRRQDSLPVVNSLPNYQRPIQVPTALAPVRPIYPRAANTNKVPDTNPCEAEVLDLSVKRKSSNFVSMEREWPAYETPAAVTENECLDLSVKKRKLEPPPLTTLSDEARGIENVTPPSPGGGITAEPAITERMTMLTPLKTPITSLNLTRSVSGEKANNAVRRTETRSPPLLIPLNETRTPYALESELIAQHQRQLQRKASEYAAYQQYTNGQVGQTYQSGGNWTLNPSLLHLPTPHRASAPLPVGPRSPNENLAAYSDLVERGILSGQIPYTIAPHMYPLMYKELQHYQSYSK